MINLSKLKTIVATHVTISMPSGSEVYGQCHAIADFLKQNSRELIFIRHPLEGKYHSKAELLTNNSVSKLKIIEAKTAGTIRYLTDVLGTILVVFKQRERRDLFIGVNSLNAFAGLFLKWLGKVKCVVFYTADYVPERFKNKGLNVIYHSLDRFCIKHANFVWNISQAQMEIRKKQGLKDDKNVYVPHGIDSRYLTRRSVMEIDRYAFVLAANLSRAFDHKLIIDAFKDVVNNVPQAKLKIIGTGEFERDIADYIHANNLGGSITMLGWMPHDKLMDFISRCGIGLAIYTSECSWTQFSDSFKTKEYLGCGCPVIISGALGAIKEAEASNAIIVIDRDKKSLYEAMIKLLGNERVYIEYRNNAINFMKNLDWQTIYSRSIGLIYSKN